MQHRKRRQFWWAERQSSVQEWYGVVFLDESLFRVEHSNGHIRVRKLLRNLLLSACIRYRYRGRVFGVVVGAAIEYTSCTSVVQIGGNFNAHLYISNILHRVVVSYLRGLPNAIFQQENAKPHVARLVLTIFDIQGIRFLPWPERSSSLSTTENL